MKIEDEIDLQISAKQLLEQDKHLVETACTFDQALEKVLTYTYDCVLFVLHSYYV